MNPVHIEYVCDCVCVCYASVTLSQNSQSWNSDVKQFSRFEIECRGCYRVYFLLTFMKIALPGSYGTALCEGIVMVQCIKNSGPRFIKIY